MTASDAQPTISSGDRSRRAQWLRSGAVALVIAGVLAVVTVKNPAFWSPANLLAIGQNISYVGPVAVGMTFVILSGGIDLSVGSLVAFSGGLGIWLMNTVLLAPALLAGSSQVRSGPVRLQLAEWADALGVAGSEPAGLAAGVGAIVLAGLLAGLANGALIAKGKLAPFIVTLGGMAIYRSLALTLADGGEFRSASEAFGDLAETGVTLPVLADAYGDPLVLPWPMLIFAGVVVAAVVTLRWTRFGRYVLAVGSNETAARYSAIRVDRVKIGVYTLAGGLTGLAGWMQASRLNAVASGSTGAMWELDAIAAVVIGGTRMSGGAGAVWRTVLGLLVMQVITNMLVLLNVSAHPQGMVKGGIIIAAVLLQRVGKRN